MMGATMARRGIFGAPLMMDAAMQPAAQSMVQPSMPTGGQVASNQPMTYTAPKRTFLDNLGLLADAFRGTHDNGQMLMAREEQARQEWLATQAAQMKRAQDFADWQKRFDYEAAHRPQTLPDVIQLAQIANDPSQPDYVREAARNRITAMNDPTVTVPLGNSVYSGPRSGLGAAIGGVAMPSGVPDKPVGKLTPIQGGASPSGSRGFR